MILIKLLSKHIIVEGDKNSMRDVVAIPQGFRNVNFESVDDREVLQCLDYEGSDSEPALRLFKVGDIAIEIYREKDKWRVVVS